MASEVNASTTIRSYAARSACASVSRASPSTMGASFAQLERKGNRLGIARMRKWGGERGVGGGVGRAGVGGKGGCGEPDDGIALWVRALCLHGVECLRNAGSVIVIEQLLGPLVCGAIGIG